ncbi:MAG: hypothetical protein ACM3XO_06090 [Bacteroidota bacterium]
MSDVWNAIAKVLDNTSPAAVTRRQDALRKQLVLKGSAKDVVFI